MSIFIVLNALAMVYSVSRTDLSRISPNLATVPSNYCRICSISMPFSLLPLEGNQEISSAFLLVSMSYSSPVKSVVLFFSRQYT